MARAHSCIDQPDRRGRAPPVARRRRTAATTPPRLWMPKTWSPHATCRYSRRRPPSRSRLRVRSDRRAVGSGRAHGGDLRRPEQHGAGVGSGRANASMTQTPAHAPSLRWRVSGGPDVRSTSRAVRRLCRRASGELDHAVVHVVLNACALVFGTPPFRAPSEQKGRKHRFWHISLLA